MQSTSVITLLTLVVQASCKDKLVDNLVHRALEAWSAHETDLDSTTMKKIHPAKGHAALQNTPLFPVPNSAFQLPHFVAPHPQSPSPLLQPTFSTPFSRREQWRQLTVMASPTSSARRSYDVLASTKVGVNQDEERLLSILDQTKGRGQKASNEQLGEIGMLLDRLEESGGIAPPVESKTIEGEWELLFTSKSSFDITNPLGRRADGSAPGVEGFFRTIFGDAAAKDMTEKLASSSPIQRAVTSIDAFTILQNIKLTETDDPRVDQIVRFAEDKQLRLSAAGSTSPGANPKRIDFTFDLAYFQFGPIRLPYPVPFRLIGKEAQGWIDTTYLSDNLRISIGNKGTRFCFRRFNMPKR